MSSSTSISSAPASARRKRKGSDGASVLRLEPGEEMREVGARRDLASSAAPRPFPLERSAAVPPRNQHVSICVRVQHISKIVVCMSQKRDGKPALS